MDLSTAHDRYFGLAIAFTAGPESKSFEEVRIDDYLQAFTSTGKPPAPYPLIPPTPQQQMMLKLPPPFEPHGIPVTAITEAAKLPAAQAWIPTNNAGDIYHSITADIQYSKYSFEELRTCAYIAGNKVPPSYLILEPFSTSPVVPVIAKNPSSSTPNLFGGTDSTEQLQSLSAQPEYANHSLEELRIAYLQAGRQLTSQELTQVAPVLPTVAATTPFAASAIFSGVGGTPFAPNVLGGGSPFTPNSGPFSSFRLN
ncbi:hypothetical protein C8J56DRAFT_818250 [Mycena floridula]|nr:hypothetical protein C8J56DRAFT_818250 [Mycena floridula]